MKNELPSNNIYRTAIKNLKIKDSINPNEQEFISDLQNRISRFMNYNVDRLTDIELDHFNSVMGIITRIYQDNL